MHTMEYLVNGAYYDRQLFTVVDIHTRTDLGALTLAPKICMEIGRCTGVIEVTGKKHKIEVAFSPMFTKREIILSVKKVLAKYLPVPKMCEP